MTHQQDNILLVEVPEDAREFYNRAGCAIQFNNKYGVTIIPIPFGYTIIGKASDHPEYSETVRSHNLKLETTLVILKNEINYAPNCITTERN